VTEKVLRAIFADDTRFAVHRPLPGGLPFADEGAANHMRLVDGASGAVHLFAWGRASFGEAPAPRRFPARQAREASEAVARLHQLHADRVLLVQQHPDGIDAGAFHTDVLAVGTGTFLMLHELAFLDVGAVIGALAAKVPRLWAAVATQRKLPVEDAVQSYAFNSQLLVLDDGSMTLLAPSESAENPKARAFLEFVLAANNPVERLEYLDLRQSMRNGGGPACLRLRVPLSDAEVAALGARIVFSPELEVELVSWVGRHYRDRLVPADLRDPQLARETFAALDELTRILALGNVYDFQS
jgi:succinylarginine dihydrolase